MGNIWPQNGLRTHKGLGQHLLSLQATYFFVPFGKSNMIEPQTKEKDRKFTNVSLLEGN